MSRDSQIADAIASVELTTAALFSLWAFAEGHWIVGVIAGVFATIGISQYRRER